MKKEKMQDVKSGKKDTSIAGGRVFIGKNSDKSAGENRKNAYRDTPGGVDIIKK